MKINLILIVFAVILAAGCNKITNYYDNRLKVSNHTGRQVVAYYSYTYPDTSLQAGSPLQSINANSWTTAPGGSITLGRGGTWETAFREQIPSGKLTVFVLDRQVFTTVPWNSIRNNYMIVKRFTVSLDELKSTNFILSVQ